MISLELLSVSVIGRRRNTPTWRKTAYLIVLTVCIHAPLTLRIAEAKRIIGPDMHPDVLPRRH
jgi:hypothetical protein